MPSLRVQSFLIGIYQQAPKGSISPDWLRALRGFQILLNGAPDESRPIARRSMGTPARHSRAGQTVAVALGALLSEFALRKGLAFQQGIKEFIGR
jgi:hypothetical protein